MLFPVERALREVYNGHKLEGKTQDGVVNARLYLSWSAYIYLVFTRMPEIGGGDSSVVRAPDS